MSEDKYKNLFPIEVAFVAGEQPSDRKLTGWGAQDKSAFGSVEKALGDLHDTNSHTGTNGGSHSFTLSDRKLQISSLGRLIGPSSWLNPDFSTRHGTFSVVVTLKCDPSGPVFGDAVCRHWVLPLKPKTYNASTKVWSDSTITVGGAQAASFSDEKNTLAAVVENGDYYVDYDGGYVYSYQGVPSGSSATFSFDTSLYPDFYEEASNNVIPDFNEASTLCTVAFVGPHYTVDTPVMTRGVKLNNVVIAGANSNLGFFGDLSSSGLATAYKSGGSGVAAGTLNYAAVDDPRDSVQLKLPAVLIDNCLAGDAIPTGFMFLYDNSTGTVVNNCTFVYASSTQVRVTPPDGVTLAAGGNRYRLVTVGTNQTEVLKSLAIRSIFHKHDGAHGDSLLSHATLTDRYLSVGLASGDESRNVFYDSQFGPIQNPHPQYLHRMGFTTSDLEEPENSGNALRGDLVLSAETGIFTSDWLNKTTIVADSFGIYFGGHPDYGTETHGYLKGIANGSSESVIEGTSGLLVAGGKKLQVKEGIAAGNHSATTSGASIVVRTPSTKTLLLRPLTMDVTATSAGRQWVLVNANPGVAGYTAGNSEFVQGHWDILASDLPTDFLTALAAGSSGRGLISAQVMKYKTNYVYADDDTVDMLTDDYTFVLGSPTDGQFILLTRIVYNRSASPDQVEFWVNAGEAITTSDNFSISLTYAV